MDAALVCDPERGDLTALELRNVRAGQQVVVGLVEDGSTGVLVHTAGFRDGLWLDANGSPLTESGKITERIRRVNFGKLEIEITVDDFKAYTKPWTVKLTQLLAPDTDLLDYYCVENEKDGSHLVAK